VSAVANAAKLRRVVVGERVVQLGLHFGEGVDDHIQDEGSLGPETAVEGADTDSARDAMSAAETSSPCSATATRAASMSRRRLRRESARSTRA